MFKKLDKMLERFDRLNELVSDSEVISRINEWREYTKELADITETVDKYLEYKKVVGFVKEPTILSTLNKIIIDKQKHLERLQQLLNNA